MFIPLKRLFADFILKGLVVLKDNILMKETDMLKEMPAAESITDELWRLHSISM